MSGIHLYIKRNPLPEELYLQFMLLLGLFFGYFEVTAFWNAGVILLTGWLLLASKRIREVVQKNATAVLLLFCLAFFIVLNVIYMGTGTYLSYNLIQIVRPIVILCGIFYISQEKNDIVYNFLSANFGLLNLMWIVNLFVLGLQVAGTGFMIKASWMAANSFYADNCTGLFGGSSTHVVMLFTIFITIYNLECGVNRFRGGWKKKIFCAYVFGTLGLMLLFSTLNDNTAMFIFVPIFLIWYYLHKLRIVDATLFYKIFDVLKYVFLAILLLFVLQFIPGVSDFINTTVINKIDGVINFENTNGLGSVERLAIASDALNRGFGWKLGQGLGAWNIMGGRYAGFLHFGLSSVGSFIYLMGIWGYLIITILYAYFMSHMRSDGAKLSFIVTFAMVNLLCFYTMFLTATHAIVWSIFIFLILNGVGMEKHGQ